MPQQEISVEDLIRREANNAGVPPELALAVAEQESGFNPTVEGPPIDKAGTRAFGTFQLLPSTAATLKVDPRDPVQNIQGGTRYLAQLLDKHQGDLNKVLAEYGGVRSDTKYVPGVLGRLNKFKTATTTPPPKTTAAKLAGTPPPNPFGAMQSEMVNRVTDMGIGALKGAGQTATNLGRLVHKIPGVSAATDYLYGAPPGFSQQSFTEADQALEPSNAWQTGGKVGEQIAEVIAPSRAITGAASAASAAIAPRAAPYVGQTLAELAPKVAVEAAGGAGLAAAQGGDPRVGAAFGAAGPVVGATAGAIAKSQSQKAEKLVEQGLGPTSQRYKAIAKKIIPGFLERGLGGSREGLIEQASSKLDDASDALDAALQQYGQHQVGTWPILQSIEDAKDAFRTVVPGTGGQPARQVIYDQRTINQLKGLQDTVMQLGPAPTVEQTIALRRVWDKIVSQAGGYQHRAGGAIGMPLADQSEAWAKREGAQAIRNLLDTQFPDLSAVNKEWAFWANVKDVLTQTVERTKPQSKGLGRMLASGAGRIAGAVVGGSTGGAERALTGALVGGPLFDKVEQVVTSPRWRFASARIRHQLAQAIMDQDTQAIASIATRVAGIQAAKFAAPPPAPVTVGAPPPARPER